MTLSEQTKERLYAACCNNDWKTLRENLIRSGIDTPLDDQGNTALHLATLHGHIDIIRLLLRYHASRTVLNNDKKTPEQMNPDGNITKQYDMPVRPKKDDNYFVATTLEVEQIEWNDSYSNAYRIAFENHQHMKQWITKISLKRLLETLDTDYLDKLTFPAENTLRTLKEQLKTAIDKNDPKSLIKMYTGTSGFYKILNRDLAELGSDFRFETTRLDYPDNEPPKNLGQYIFACIVINHRVFRDYQFTGETYRGMSITVQDLEVYQTGKIIITRSFLSTSMDRKTTELFLNYEDEINRPPVLCKYTLSNPQSSLWISSLSMIPGEDEVLVAPFTVFEIGGINEIVLKTEQTEHRVKEIELVEHKTNPN